MLTNRRLDQSELRALFNATGLTREPTAFSVGAEKVRRFLHSARMH